MQDQIRGVLSVQEAYVDDMDTPTVILHGETDMGPTTIHVKATSLELVGLIIGEAYHVDIKIVSPTEDQARLRSVYENLWSRDAQGTDG